MTILSSIKLNIYQLIDKYFKTEKTKNNIPQIKSNLNINLNNKLNTDSFSDLTTSSYDYYLSHEYLLNNVKQEFDFHVKDPESERPLFSPEEFSKIYSNILLSEQFFNQNKELLNFILQDASFIYKTLAPLESLGLKFSLDIVGGAARDLLLNKEIKDLDICLYWDKYYGVDITEIENEYELFYYLSPSAIDERRNKIKSKTLSFINRTEIQKIFTEDEMSNVNYLENDDIQDNINKILLMCMNRTNDVSFVKLFSEDERFKPQPDSNYGPQMTEILTSLIKIETKNTHFPIDLIATDKNRYEFMKNVDFDICKVGFCLTNSESIITNSENLNQSIQSKHLPFPSNIDDFFKRSYSSINFWEDIFRKTITFDSKDKTIAQIQFSFDERSSRLIKKYPEYPIIINSPYSEFYAEAKVALLNSQLTLELDKKIDSKTIKRNKL